MDQNKSATDILYLSRFEILDCGNPEGLRYELEAVETDKNDTSRVATVHLGAFYSRETAQLVLDALVSFQATTIGERQ